VENAVEKIRNAGKKVFLMMLSFTFTLPLVEIRPSRPTATDTRHLWKFQKFQWADQASPAVRADGRVIATRDSVLGNFALNRNRFGELELTGELKNQTHISRWRSLAWFGGGGLAPEIGKRTAT